MALRPYSRGYIHIQSADPAVQPRIDPNYLADERDVATLLAGIRAVRRLCRCRAERPGVRETRPGPEVQTEQQAIDYIRNHRYDMAVVGTCRIGNDEMALSIPIFAFAGWKVCA